MPEAVQKRQGLQVPQVMKRCVNDKCEYTAHYDVQTYSGFCCGKCRYWLDSGFKKGTPSQHGPNCISQGGWCSEGG